MRVSVVIAICLTVAIPRVFACSCAGPGTPCSAAGNSAAAFTGTVIEIANLARPVSGADAALPGIGRRTASSVVPAARPLRTIRLQVGQVLAGVAPGQKQVEILTGMGGGDCGYPFEIGAEYAVYAYQNSDGNLETGICSRTRPIAQAAEDLEYFRAMANAPETGEIRVRTGFGMSGGKPGVPIALERDGSRYQALTNAAGEAVFSDMIPGAYTIHGVLDGDFPDDPVARLYAKGCLDATLLRTLRITGRVVTATGAAAARIEVQARSVQNVPDNSAITDFQGRYELRINQPGQYYFGVNLNHTPTRDTPYPRWFYPGTADPGSALKIDFSGHPETLNYDLTLPDRQPERTIGGSVLNSDGQAMPRAVVTVVDDSRNVIAQAFADQSGRFSMKAFTGTAYRLHAVWPGRTGNDAASAVPMDIVPGTAPLNLRLILTQPGNSFIDERQPIGIRR